ncbi:MAG: putative cobalamin [Herbaspirillum sp.]|nr:putative cobalamin [Herbaspirillum sp.]
MTKRALILFAHGARDPAWMAPFLRLQTLLQTQQPGLMVKLAFLELMTPDLPQCVAQLLPDGIDDITVVPVFLGQGGHVQRDLPQLIATLRLAYPGLSLQAAAPVGEDADVLDAMARYCLRSLSV